MDKLVEKSDEDLTEDLDEEELESVGTEKVEEKDDSDIQSTEQGEKSPELEEYYKILIENSILNPNEDFEFEGTEESIKEAFQQTNINRNEQALQTIWNALPNNEFRELLEYGLNGGTSLDEFKKVFVSEDYDNMDLTDESTQELILKDYYKKTTPYSDDKINKLVNRLKEYDELESETEDAIEYLKKHAEEQKLAFKQKQEADKELQIQQQKELRDKITNALENSSNITGKRKSTVKNFIFNPIERNGIQSTEYDRYINSIYNNVDHYVEFANFIKDNYDPDKGWTFKGITKSTKNKATSEFQKTLSERISASKNKVRGNAPNRTDNRLPNWDAIFGN
jgi:nucleotide-binding universal stress UspA family protein